MRSRGWSEVTVGERSKTLGRLALALLVWLAPGCRSAAQAEDYSERIIWWEQEKNNARFIPEEVLSSMPLEQLPLLERDRESLRMEMSLRRNAGSQTWPGGPSVPPRVVPECDSSLNRPLEPGSVPHAQLLVDWVRSVEIVAVGRIVDIVPGWDRRQGWIGQAVYVSIEDNIKGAGPARFPGGVMAFLEPTEVVWVGDTRLCATLGESPPSRRQVGDTVLLTGAKDDVDPLLMTGATVNRVEQGKIRFRPYPFIATLTDLPLAELRTALSSQRGQEGAQQ